MHYLFVPLSAASESHSRNLTLKPAGPGREDPLRNTMTPVTGIARSSAEVRHSSHWSDSSTWESRGDNAHFPLEDPITPGSSGLIATAQLEIPPIGPSKRLHSFSLKPWNRRGQTDTELSLSPAPDVMFLRMTAGYAEAAPAPWKPRLFINLDMG